jgi:fumarylpyruvate hydrolase
MNPGARSSVAGFVFAPEATPRVPVQGTGDSFPVRRIYCVGSNYREHAREMGSSLREPPCFFSKPANAVFTGEAVPYPPMTQNLHHEVELVVALAGGGFRIPVENALDNVFGYAVGVDLTRRDLQADAKKQGRPWSTAKSFDHSAPISAIRPVSEMGHPESASIRLDVNNEVRQQADISDMTWSVPEIIAELSRYFELKAGDLIFTGTPSGVGRLLPDDHVDCAIDMVGSLSFMMAGEPASQEPVKSDRLL